MVLEMILDVVSCVSVYLYVDDNLALQSPSKCIFWEVMFCLSILFSLLFSFLLFMNIIHNYNHKRGCALNAFQIWCSHQNIIYLCILLGFCGYFVFIYCLDSQLDTQGVRWGAI